MPDEKVGTDPLDIPDPETGQTPRELAEMGWPMTGEPIEDPIELQRQQARFIAAWKKRQPQEPVEDTVEPPR